MSPGSHAPQSALTHGPLAFAGPGLLALGLFLMFAEPNARAEDAFAARSTTTATEARDLHHNPASIDSATVAALEDPSVHPRAPRRTDARQLAIAR